MISTDLQAGLKCPACGRAIDCATPAHDKGVPKPGDVGVCLRCAEPRAFWRTMPS